MVVRCGKCKSSDVEAAYPPTRLEEILAWVVPLAPYQCDKCERRFFSWASPLMDRNRTIAAGVLVGLLSLAVILFAMSEPDLPVAVVQTRPAPAQEPVKADPKPEPVEPEPSAEQAAPVEVPTAAAAGEASPSATSVAEPASVTAAATPPPQAEEQPQPTMSPADGRFSASVLKRLQENQARDRGAPIQSASKTEVAPKAEQPSATKTTKPAQSKVNAAPSTKGAEQAEAPKTSQAKSPPPETGSADKPVNATQSAKKQTKPAVAATPKQARLDDIRIEIKGDDLEIHLVCSGPLMPERGLTKKVFFVDLPGTWTINRKLGDRKLDHPLVSGMRLGKHTDHMRVAFDLRDKPIDATFKVEDSGLLIRVTPKQ